jgi:hypothetical protein
LPLQPPIDCGRVCSAGEALKQDASGGNDASCRCVQVVASTVTFNSVARVEDFNPVAFKALQAAALGTKPSSVIVNSVVAGSVVVDYHIQPEGAPQITHARVIAIRRYHEPLSDTPAWATSNSTRTELSS